MFPTSSNSEQVAKVTMCFTNTSPNLLKLR